MVSAKRCLQFGTGDDGLQSHRLELTCLRKHHKRGAHRSKNVTAAISRFANFRRFSRSSAPGASKRHKAMVMQSTLNIGK